MYINDGDNLKIYLDLVFLINFIIDFFILYGVKKVLKLHPHPLRLLLGSLVGSLSILLLFIKLNNYTLLLSKFVISILIILVSFGKKNFFKNITYFYLLSIILGGSFYLFDIGITYHDKGFLVLNNNHLLNFLILLIGSPIIIFLFIKENIKYKSIYSNKYIVEIYINKKKYILEGMIDTGNQLIDPYKKRSIILVNLPLKKTAKYIYVPYKALNTSGVIPCLKPDKVIIKDKLFLNYLIGFSKEKFELNGIECILPNKLKEEL